MKRRPSAFHKNKSTCPCFDQVTFAGVVPHANGRLNSRSNDHGSAPREHTKRAAMAANRMLTAIAKIITRLGRTWLDYAILRPHRPHRINPIAVRAMRKMPGKTLAPG